MPDYTVSTNAAGEAVLTEAQSTTHQGLTKQEILQQFVNTSLRQLAQQQNAGQAREINDKLAITTQAAKIAAKNDINAGITAPTIADIPNRADFINVAVSVPVVASNIYGLPMVVKANNLPPGITVKSDQVTGEPVLGGIPITAGAFNVTVRAYMFTDIYGQDTFTWTINT